jgi:hypothetical protein
MGRVRFRLSSWVLPPCPCSTLSQHWAVRSPQSAIHNPQTTLPPPIIPIASLPSPISHRLPPSLSLPLRLHVPSFHLETQTQLTPVPPPLPQQTLALHRQDPPRARGEHISPRREGVWLQGGRVERRGGGGGGVDLNLGERACACGELRAARRGPSRGAEERRRQAAGGRRHGTRHCMP